MQSSRPSRRADTIAVALLALVVSLPTIVTVARGPAICFAGSSDLVPAVLSVLDDYARHVREDHELPLWRTTPFYGFSSGMDSQDRVFYPPMLVYAVLGLPLGHHVYLLLHALVFALGTYAVLRGERLLPTAAFAGAAMIGLCTRRFGYEVAGWESVLGPISYAPAIVALHRRSVGRCGSRASALLLAGTVTLAILAGNGMVPIFLGLVLPLGGLVGLRRRFSWCAARRHAQASLAGFGLGFALAAPMILSTLELARRSHRAHVDVAYGFPFHLEAIETLRALVVADLSRRNGSWETSNAIGLAALPFACAALLGRRHRRAFPAFLIASFLLLAADETTLTGRLVSHLPVLGQFSFRTRLLWVPSIGLALLAGSGIDAFLRRRPGRPVRRLAAGLTVGILLTVLAYVPALAGLGEARPSQALPVLVGLAFLLLLPGLVLVRVRGRFAGTILVIALTLLELLWLSGQILDRVPFERLESPSKVRSALEASEHPRLAVLSPRSWEDPVVPSFPSSFDRIGGYTPLYPDDTARFLEAIEETSSSAALTSGTVEVTPAELKRAKQGPPHRPFFELVGVARPDLLAIGATHLATRRSLEGLALVTSETRPIYAPDSSEVVLPTRLYRVDHALPRAFLMTRAEAVPASDQLEVLRREAPFDGTHRLLVEGPVPSALAGVSPGPAPVEIVEHHANRVVIRAVAPEGGGYVVLLEAHSPEWTATVDGVAAPIERADHLFRAVRVDGGPHIVAFEIHLSKAFLQGCAVSALALLLTAGWLARAARQSIRPRASFG